MVWDGVERRAYDGEWTERRGPTSIRRGRTASKAAARARQRLIEAHREEYEKYFAEEREILQLEPIKKSMRRTKSDGDKTRNN